MAFPPLCLPASIWLSKIGVNARTFPRTLPVAMELMLKFLNCLKAFMYCSEGPLNADAPKSWPEPVVFPLPMAAAMEVYDWGPSSWDVAGMERNEEKIDEGREVPR